LSESELLAIMNGADFAMPSAEGSPQ
jgi:hypothetical protein